MNNKVTINTREISKDGWKQNDMFDDVEINVDENIFIKSHMLDKNNGITSELREYLYNILDVSKVEDLVKILGVGWKLTIEDGISDPIISLQTKVLKIYYGDFEIFYFDKKNVSKSSKTIKDLFNDDKNPSTAQLTKIIEKIADRSKELTFIEKEKESLAESIPDILINNNIRLKKDDIFDINKIEVEEIVEIGRMIIKGDRRAAKKLNVPDVKKEQAWQKYFEKFGTYLLFGSIELDPQVCLDKEKTKEFNNRYPDILTRNRYGFIDIIELKRSDIELFKFDSSHNKFVPTSYLNGALSQLNGYLQTIPYAFNVEDAKKQSLECASGMLIVGCTEKLLKKTADLDKWIEKNNITEDDLKFMVRQELRKLNYSYSHIQVVLYDELIDTLEQFINNIR